MNTIYGNIIDYANDGNCDVVLHNCNCFNTMGAGIAKAFAEAWPEVLHEDQKTISGDESKLGHFTKAYIPTRKGGFDVYNIYGQYKYGPRYQQNFDLVAFTKAINLIAEDLERIYGGRIVDIAFPLLGTGNAGGRWSKIVSVLKTVLDKHNLTLVRLAK